MQSVVSQTGLLTAMVRVSGHVWILPLWQNFLTGPQMGFPPVDKGLHLYSKVLPLCYIGIETYRSQL